VTDELQFVTTDTAAVPGGLRSTRHSASQSASDGDAADRHALDTDRREGAVDGARPGGALVLEPQGIRRREAPTGGRRRRSRPRPLPPPSPHRVDSSRRSAERGRRHRAAAVARAFRIRSVYSASNNLLRIGYTLTATTRLRFDGHWTAVRLLIKGR